MSRRMASLFLILCGLHSFASGGERSQGRGMGMARTFVASSRSLDAIGINPANLSFPVDGTVTASILPFGFHVGSDVLNYDLYVRYFTGEDTDEGRRGVYLTEANKNEILDSFTDRSAFTTIELSALLLGVAVHIPRLGAVALTISDHAEAHGELSKDYFELILKGNPVGSSYNFGDTDVMSAWTRSYALSAGVQVPGVRFLKNFSVGVGAQLIHGFGFFEMERFNATLNTSDNATLQGSVDLLLRRAGTDPTRVRDLGRYNLASNPAGIGFGIDLGIAGAIENEFFFGISVTDIGSIRWRRGVSKTRMDTSFVIDDVLNSTQRENVEKILKGRSEPTEPFVTPLPTTVRAGFGVLLHRLSAFEGMPGEFILEINYNQRISHLIGSLRNPRISIGFEYIPVPWIPLRTGFSMGGTDNLNIALGFGIDLGVFALDVGSENVTWIFVPDSFSYGSFALSTRFRF